MEYRDQEFVEMVVKEIVDNPDKVKTERKVDEMGVLIELTVAPEDMGKIIGKEGKTAKSIRTLLRVIGAKERARVNMKIIEPETGRIVKEPEEGIKPEESEKKEGKKEEKKSDEEEVKPIEEKSTETGRIVKEPEEGEKEGKKSTEEEVKPIEEKSTDVI